ncbi:helix-turn-helix domain-containing protein [Paraflavitalea sp. CAU 1676]|uniref:winged helix-turn-helix transcriptional regulator n=1 Tax=Paraflavitalea sp. CAU 1676 TaxID=3032598 RepID=UPI0023DA534B|nr:helix-turn-helix domain-containing protein [Paraflavitalea sp. CAU 1676]MDF2189865.1 helix-turn-helix domain-containing protein [Paraflavitalea sp. CAU 1676]
MENAHNGHHLSGQCVSVLDTVDDALYVIGGKWKLRIIIALSDGRKRFNELQRSIKGISARVLSNELKDLELNGFVKRIVDENSALSSVAYERTDYANTLRSVIGSLHEWGEMHRKKIMQP